MTGTRTRRISSVAYADDERLSDANTASAVGLAEPLVLELLGVRAAARAACSSAGSRCSREARCRESAAAEAGRRDRGRRFARPGHGLHGASQAGRRIAASDRAPVTMPTHRRALSDASVATSVRGRSVSVHVVVVGCGRVGSELAGALELGGHTRRGRRQERKEAFRRLPPVVRRQDRSSVSGSTATPRSRRSIDRGRRTRRGHERRQLQHHGGPRRARDLRDRARRRPHLRPSPRRDLPAARHPDRRDVAWTTDQVLRRLLPGDHAARAGPTRPARSASSSATFPPVGRAAARPAREPSRFKLVVGHPPRRGAVFDSRPRRPGRRHPAPRRRDRTPRRAPGAARRPEAGGSTDAGRDRRRRQRRLVHRRASWSRPATTSC